ncbi:SLC13 family permease [Lactobacillus delbrueckii]|uniref:SLC13 family permease n=1 Tax=Lactobacillus delbrueckii TaxID=1584 RepID=UPI0000510B05|nr:SLC13 family permease [Lactobacillus delbrueckii]ABJ57818.1 transporter, YbiR family [Lactobacillus delbrueckii subsp. bulgaricus ATCC BAA-365]MBT8938049.1 cation transporter [Lactobacillus delbrueckii subsp. bulgaricus]
MEAAKSKSSNNFLTTLKKIFSDRILQITIVITIISLFFARPLSADMNWHTIESVTTMLVLIQVYSYLHVLDIIAYKLAAIADSTRKLILLFTLLSVFSGMFLGNDITCLTMIPLYLNIAKKYKLPEILPATLIGMGANIGAAFTPWGNPHNIFVVSNYHLAPAIFFKWTLPYLIVAMVVFLCIFFFIPKKNIPTQEVVEINVSWPMTMITTVIFFFFVGVFKFVPIWMPMLASIIWALIVNWKILLHIDYSLLLTFTLFFVFISDIQQIPFVVALIHGLVGTEMSTYWTSILSSQVMSNVPSTILVGKFSKYAEALTLGSNIGGFGSPIGSMANMLVMRTFYAHASKDAKKKFFPKWLGYQIAGLIILSLIGWVIVKLNL